MESKKRPVLYVPFCQEEFVAVQECTREAQIFARDHGHVTSIEPYIPVARVREMIATLRADQSDAIDWSSRVDALEILIADVEEP